jgi:hypothetical protein
MRVTRTHTVSIPIDATFSELYQLTIQELQALPTLSSGQDSDLKYESERYRVWCSRMSIHDYDGNNKAYSDERIQIEELIDGRWEMLDRYGKRVHP